MPLNVELRAQITDIDQTIRKVADLTGTEPIVVDQHDVYFHVPRGRLMLRRQDNAAELIYYSKAAVRTPRTSAYFRRPVNDPEAVEAELADEFGVRGRVVKRRWQFEVKGTRINIDSVETLGNFVEIGVPARDPTVIPHARASLRKVADALGLDEDVLVAHEYETLIEKPKLLRKRSQ